MPRIRRAPLDRYKAPPRFIVPTALGEAQGASSLGAPSRSCCSTAARARALNRGETRTRRPMMPSRQSLRCAAAAIDKTWLQRLLLEQAEDAAHEDDQIDRQIEIVEAFDDLLARPRD